MSKVTVLNTRTGADFTCTECFVQVSAAVHVGEPVCLDCQFLRFFPEEHRWEMRRRFFPHTISSPIIIATKYYANGTKE